MRRKEPGEWPEIVGYRGVGRLSKADVGTFLPEVRK